MSVHIIGMGMGTRSTMTLEAQDAILSADVIIGSDRLIRSLPEDCRAIRYAAIVTEEILRVIGLYTHQHICVLMSGDVGFYSGAARLTEALTDREVTLLPGISTVPYFAAKLKRPWQGWKLASAHGKIVDVAGLVRDHSETFFLTGGEFTAPAICRILQDAGLGHCIVSLGQNLGTEEEKIITGNAADLAVADPVTMAVLLVDNPSPRRLVSCGLTDEAFIRGNVPMTKSEVRSVVLSKLRLRDDDIFYDIGAGTGSVSIEAAFNLKNGHVFAFEQDSEGCQLIKANAKKHSIANLTLVEGEAPSTFLGLPSPTAAFIGGSGGNLEEILTRLLSLDPEIRLVLSAVALETLEAASSLFFRLPLRDVEIVQIAVSRAKKLGGHHLMTAQNPIYLFSAAGNGN